MSTLAQRNPIESLIPLAFGAFAAMIGVLAGVDPRLAAATAFVVAFLLIALADLTAGLIGLVILSFVAFVPGASGSMVSMTKLAGLVLAISWLASASGSGRRWNEFPATHPGITLTFAGLIAWSGLSALWAEDPGRVPFVSVSFLVSLAVLPIAYAAIRSKANVRSVMLAFICGAAATAVYGLFLQPDASGLAVSADASRGMNRLAGTFEDPNDFATVLVVAIALSSAVLFDPRNSFALRAAVGAGASIMLLATLVTLSRGGLVALAAVLLVGVAAAGRHRPKALLALILVTAAAFAFFQTSPHAYDRITRSDGGSGRTDIWTVGWRMVEEEPIRGVGAGNFQVTSIHHLFAPGVLRFDEFIVDQPAVAHNSYLQVLAELGAVGLMAFIGIVGACIAAGWRAKRIFARGGDREGELLAAALIIAIGAYLAAAFFLSNHQSNLLWLLLALGPAMLKLARESEATIREGARPRELWATREPT